MLIRVTSKPILAGLKTVFIPDGDWEVVVGCPVCGGSQELREVARVQADRAGVTASVCRACSFGFLSRRPSRDWMEQFYASDWDQRGRESTDRSPSPVPNKKALRFVKDHLPSGGAVLDVGAGFGDMLLSFREAGHPVFAMEQSRHRTDFIRDHLGIPCSRSLSSPEFPEQFELICMNHVLEHLYDPRVHLERLHSRIREGGWLYVAVPDFWQEFPPQAVHFVPHLSWFTLAALEKLLRVAGFEVVKKQVNKEIQILAQKLPLKRRGNRKPEGPRAEDFWPRVGKHMSAGFGGKEGRHTLIWYEDPESEDWLYSRKVISESSWKSGAVRSGIRLMKVLPGRVRRPLLSHLPDFLRPGTRVLTIESESRTPLPLDLVYPSHRAPVWVK